jgi:hypothetical protein
MQGNPETVDVSIVSLDVYTSIGFTKFVRDSEDLALGRS